MLNVHIGRVAALGRTLASPELDNLLFLAKRDWLIAARNIRAAMEDRLVRGAWPEALSARLQHYVTQMSEAEARINELVVVDLALVRHENQRTADA